ncbi:MAG: sodium:solute symporter, partial [Bryobacteraceae bacterium]
GLTIASILYGSLLGVFLLGLLTNAVQENAAMLGMVTGLITMICVFTLTNIAFTWYVLIGTAATFGVGWAASFILGRNGTTTTRALHP